MYSPIKGPSTPTEVVFAQIQHVSRRSYRYVALAACASLLLIGLPALWMYIAASVDCTAGPCAGFTFDLSLSSFFPLSTSQSEVVETGPHIPKKIWQIFLGKIKRHGDHFHETKFINPGSLTTVPSWLALNPDYDYTLVSSKRAEKFLQEHFSHQPRIIETYHNMTNVGMRSDFLRYLLLSVEGGVYSDTDTLAIKSVDNWIDLELRDKVRLVVGIEFDRLDGPWWGDIPHELQFCQWTIAAAPGHPVFQKMVNRTLVALDELSGQQGGAPIPDLKLESMDVMNTTGPAAWTDAVFLQLQEYEPALFSVRDLAFMTEPRLIGDVLVLPIDAFGMGQLHSNSTNDGTIPRAALIKHEFYGSWRPDEYEYQ